MPYCDYQPSSTNCVHANVASAIMSTQTFEGKGLLHLSSSTKSKQVQGEFTNKLLLFFLPTSLSTPHCFSYFNLAEVDAPTCFESKQHNHRNNIVNILNERTFSYKLCLGNTCSRVYIWYTAKSITRHFCCCREHSKTYYLSIYSIKPYKCIKVMECQKQKNIPSAVSDTK